MSKAVRIHFSKAAIEALPNPPAGKRATYHDDRIPALALRITETGHKTFRVRGRPHGRLEVETLTIGAFPAVPVDRARAEAAAQVARWARGESIADQRRAEDELKRSSITFEDALREYVAEKRRGKDGLPLKPRTRDDYLQMIAPADATARRGDGLLRTIADRPLNELGANDIREAHAAAAARGSRVAAYAMAVLRAVLNWHGIAVPDNPLAKTTAGRDRIRIAQAAGQPNPIPVERLGAWWRAASAPASGDDAPTVAADYLRFLLLTGCRSIEVKGAKRAAKSGDQKPVVYGSGILVKDVDLVARRVQLNDTKNRSDHVIHLSTQAVEILRRHVRGKTPAAPVFEVGDVRPQLDAINTAAGVTVTPHDLRATFASIAEELVSVYALKRMLNHAAAGDVTAGHYVAKSESQLRAGWQAVADFIDAQAAPAAGHDANTAAA